MSLKDRITNKNSSNPFGDGKDEISSKQKDSTTKKAHILIGMVKKQLIKQTGLDEDYFDITNWYGKQLQVAKKMVKNRQPEEWMEILDWCLSHPTNEFAQKVVNLRALVNYLPQFLGDKRAQDVNGKTGDTKAEREKKRIKEKIRKEKW